MDIITLKNGLRIVFDELDHVRSAAINIYIKCGSGYETADMSGVSHFIEHMLFKGTSHRSSADIAEQMDEIGGRLNAYTSKEYTCVYTQSLSEHTDTAFEIVSDMLLGSVYSDKDIETEKGVICEEIGMYDDSPEDVCSDMLYAGVWPNSALGRTILGARETVNSLSRDKILSYINLHYAPNRMVISVSGKFDRQRMTEDIDKYFGHLKPVPDTFVDAPGGFAGGITLAHRDFEQTNIIIAFEGISALDDMRYPVALMSSVAGGSSSSRLNRRIREELGMAYSIYTFATAHSCAGIFGISAGVSHDNQEKVIDETLSVLKGLKNGISKAELKRIKEQFKSSIVMSMESPGARASNFGHNLMVYDKILDEDMVLNKIDAVTLEEINHAANRLINLNNIHISAAGRTLTEDVYRRIISNHL